MIRLGDGRPLVEMTDDLEKKNAPQRTLGTSSDPHAFPKAEKRHLEKYISPIHTHSYARHMPAARKRKDWAIVMFLVSILF